LNYILFINNIITKTKMYVGIHTHKQAHTHILLHVINKHIRIFG